MNRCFPLSFALLSIALASSASAQDLIFQRQLGGSELSRGASTQMAPRPGTNEYYNVIRVGRTSYLGRYDTFGNQLAIAPIVDPFGSQVAVDSMVVDSGGNAIVAYRTSYGDLSDVTVSKYSPSLARLWSHRRATPTEDDRQSVVMTVDDSNAVYFACQIYSTQFDVRVSKVNSSGVEQWQYLFGAGPNDTVNVIRHNPNTNKVYYAGGSGSFPYVSALTETGAFGGQHIEGVGAQNAFNQTTDLVCLDSANSNEVVIYGIFDGGTRFLRRLNEGLNTSVSNVTGSAGLSQQLKVAAGALFTSSQNGVNSLVERRDLATLAVTHSQSFAAVTNIRGITVLGDESTLFAAVGPANSTNSSLGVVMSTTNLGSQSNYIVSGLKSAGPVIPIGTNRFALGYAAAEGSDTNAYSALIDNAATQIWQYGEQFEAPVRTSVQSGAVDSQNNYYALTTVEGATERIQVVKYDAAGVVQWSQPLTGNNHDGAIVIGADDQPVIARSNDNTTAVLVTKLNGTGGTVWDRSFVAEITDKLYLAVGTDGTLAMACSLTFTLGNYDSAIYKLNPTTGAQIWRRLYDSNTWSEYVRGLQVAPSGYIMTVGFSEGSGSEGYTLVYAPNGDLHWQFTLSGASIQNVLESSLSMQTSGLGATVHMYLDNSGTYRFSLVRFDPVRRQTLFTGALTGNVNRPSFESATSPAGTVYIAQANPLSKGLIQYNSNGTVAWVRTLPSGVTSVQRVITDAQNSVYVLAQESFVDSNGIPVQGWYLVKYNTLGNFVSQRRIQAGPSMNALPSAIAMGKVFDLWLSGSIETQNTGTNLAVVRHGQQVAPTVSGESYTVPTGQTLVISAPGVLANDIDLNGDTLTASIVSNPSAGTLTLNANGSFTYVAPATTGPRTFTYRVTDSTGRSTNAVCTINVN